MKPPVTLLAVAHHAQGATSAAQEKRLTDSGSWGVGLNYVFNF